MFSGPTGVGKTELAKKLAETLGIEFIRFDMSEYMEKHTVSRLIGSPPGYVGFDQGGQLTEAVHKNPHAVLLLDEIEKAHEDIYNILLQVMDHATLTDSNGRKVDFRQIILIFTTNTGSRESSRRNLGFTQKEYEDKSTEAIDKFFSPEFRNRLTSIINFNALDLVIIEKIVDKLISELEERLKNKKIKIQLTSEARTYLAENGYDSLLGARPIQRLIDREITERLSKEILFGEIPIGGTVEISLEDGSLSFNYSR
jgi:ATP-dependent Clp protease ATP-binding subunit ClpA